MYTATGQLDRTHAIEQFAPLVKRMAHHLVAKLPPSVEADDIIQAGLIGLMDAVSRFEDGAGVQFETYAAQRIRGAMLDELRANDWLPRSIRKCQREVEGAITRLEQRLKRTPTESEMAKELGVGLREYHEMLQEARGYQLIYLEDFGGEEEGGADAFLDRNLADRRFDPLDRLSDQRFRTELVRSIEGLPEREKLLMGLYYEQELNFREIAEIMGVTESRVCQLHSQAVARLRSKLKNW